MRHPCQVGVTHCVMSAAGRQRRGPSYIDDDQYQR
jgi:hypothetical protein